jgi:hypothetical protein
LIVCLASASAGVPQLADVAPRLAAVSPRVIVEPRGVMWCDAHGLDARSVARGALRIVRDEEGSGTAGLVDARAGIAQTPIGAEVAAISGMLRPAPSLPPAVISSSRTTFVPPGVDAAFLAPHSVAVLAPSPHLLSLLRGSGVERCGDLATLEHESVEVRFGAEGSRVWRLARADDRRRLFPPMQRTLPSASFEWLDYVLTEPERLLFVINGLMANVCEQLSDRGAGAREIALTFSLANRSTFGHRLRPARVTASQRAWMRLVRSDLERIQLPDAVTGIELSVLSLGGELGRQGDLFDRGFASARVTEEALSQLLDDRGSALVTPRSSRHPMVERRTEWLEQDATAAVTQAVQSIDASPRLTLQIFPGARAVLVETARRRDHEIPVRCCLKDGWEDVASVAGPDRISGGGWESPFARDYFRCVTNSGRMIWLYRDAEAKWWLAGWWD